MNEAWADYRGVMAPPMLLLTFQAAGDIYAINVARVVEVVPRIILRQLPHAPSFLAGVFDYRGQVVPVVDLGVLLGSEKCRDCLSTRLILVDSHLDVPSPSRPPKESNGVDLQRRTGTSQSREGEQSQQHPWLLGLVAEQVSDVAPVTPEQVISASLDLPATPYLGAIVEINHKMVQLIKVDRVLEDSLRQSLFRTSSDNEQTSIAASQAEAGPTNAGPVGQY